jgi:hypothetical protein
VCVRLTEKKSIYSIDRFVFSGAGLCQARLCSTKRVWIGQVQGDTRLGGQVDDYCGLRGSCLYETLILSCEVIIYVNDDVSNRCEGLV